MSSWEKTIPKRNKIKRSDKSILAVAEKSHTTQEPSKLSHITTKRTKGPPNRARKPPSRKPMVARTTKLSTKPISEDVSLVANRKEPPNTLAGGTEDRPVLREKDKEIRMIEQNKRKSMVQSVGQKQVMRIFLDNNGIGFKTVQITPNCTMYELVEIMRKKLFTDTTGFGIWEVRDKLDVQLIHPNDTVKDVNQYWEDSKSYKFVFKKALGEKAKLYYKPPSSSSSSVKKTNSFGGPMGVSPKPDIRSSSPAHQSNPFPESTIKAELEKNSSSSQTNKPVAKRPPPGMSSELRSSTESIAQEILKKQSLKGHSSSPSLNSPNTDKNIRRIPPTLPNNASTNNVSNSPQQQRRVPPRGNNRARGNPIRGRGMPKSTTPGSTRRAPPPINSNNNTNNPTNNTNITSSPTPTPKVEKVIVETDNQPNPEPTPQPISEPTPQSKPKETTNNTKHITEWSIEEVGDWVEKLGFGAVKSIFVDNYISGEELVELTNQELKEDLGVKALGARKGILREISKLNV